MTDHTTSLPPGLHLLQQAGFADPDDPHRPNRICICLSDLHFTDGTVGNQSADAVVWERVFNTIIQVCVCEQAVELFLILDGDVVDLLRSSQWYRYGIFPWDRESERYRTDADFRTAFRRDLDVVLHNIMRGIVQLHAEPPRAGAQPGFFYLLKRLPEMLRSFTYTDKATGRPLASKVERVCTLALLGNHDKEILLSGEALRMFYEQCLGKPLAAGGLSEEYRRWIGAMYFDDTGKFLARDSAPWTPLYWADRGFRLFVTHGHWRDPENCRPTRGPSAATSWQVTNGWDLEKWQRMEFAPFTRPCWGDAIVAGLLAGYIGRSKSKLELLEQELRHDGQWTPDDDQQFGKLRRVLDELDLYRPTAAAFLRMRQLTRGLGSHNPNTAAARRILEKEFSDSVLGWINLPFVVQSVTGAIPWLIRIFRIVLNSLNFFRGARRPGVLSLGVGYKFFALMAWLGSMQRDAPTRREMRGFPAFLQDYRACGFRLHCEGHTHIPLQEDLYFGNPATPPNRQSYNYINFGTWRDQVSRVQQNKYRRRGVGRALVVLDQRGEDGNRRFGYYLEDVASWSDGADAWDAP